MQTWRLLAVLAVILIVGFTWALRPVLVAWIQRPAAATAAAPPEPPVAAAARSPPTR